MDNKMQASITKYMNNLPKSCAKSSYSSLTMNELKLLCKKNGLTGYSRLKKDELVTFLDKNSGVGLVTCFELKKDVKKGNKTNDNSKSKRNHPSKILQYLVNTKQIILLQRIKDAKSNIILYHPTTNLVFNEIELKKTNNYIVVGYLTQNLEVLPITKDMINVCKQWNFEYILPENISTIDPNKEHKLEDNELDNILYKTGIIDDDDDVEVIPNYDDLY